MIKDVEKREREKPKPRNVTTEEPMAGALLQPIGFCAGEEHIDGLSKKPLQCWWPGQRDLFFMPTIREC